jgi:peptide/nickel transport system substrate-binding protein
MGCLRFNHLFPPFDNAAIRRIVVSAMNQHEIMQAVAGAAPELIAPACGIFIPGTPMASTTGIAEAMPGGADPAALQKQLAQAGYNGQKIVLLCASDFPTINAEAQVCADTLKRIGFNVDYQSLDWGTVVQRRASKEPPDKGGWNIFFTFLGGTGNVSPASNIAIRSGGATAWFGWPTDPAMDALRAAWFDAPDLAAQKALCEKMQVRFWEDPPYAPLGTYFQPTAFRTSLKNVRDGFPLFFGVERS